MKKMDVDFWVAVAALLCSVWAVVDCRNMKRAMLRDCRSFQRQCDENHNRLVEESYLLRTKVEKVERAVFYPDSVTWPPGVLRTPSGPRPEIKNVEGKP